MAWLSNHFYFIVHLISRSYNPIIAETTMVWAFPLSLATTQGITIVFFSSSYLDVSVHWVGAFAIPLHGTRFPHSEIFGSKLMCSYPKLIAAYRVLHRLWKPRHPPFALTYFLNQDCLYIRNNFMYLLPVFQRTLNTTITRNVLDR